MSKKPTYKHLPDDVEYLRYLSDAMSPAERHRFERRVAADPFASEALEGLEGLSAAELRADLTSLRSNKDDKKRRILAPVYRIAASILLLAGLSISGYFVLKHPPASAPVVAEEILPVPAPLPPALPVAEDGVLSEVQTRVSTNNKETSSVKKPESPQSVTIVSDDADYDTDIRESEAFSIIESADIQAEEAAPASAKRSAAGIAPEPTKEGRKKTEQTVRGKVLDSSTGEPLIGAAIRQGNKSVVSDLDGHFELKGADTAKPVDIAYLGYVAESKVLNSDSENTIALTEDVTALSEVVVVGYGVQKKRV